MTMSEQQPGLFPDEPSQRSAPVETLDEVSVERRALLVGAVAVTAGAFSIPAAAAPQSPDLSAALAKFRASIPSHFDRDYVENVVVPFYLTSIYEGERPILPMIDLPLTKQDALPYDLGERGETTRARPRGGPWERRQADVGPGRANPYRPDRSRPDGAVAGACGICRL